MAAFRPFTTSTLEHGIDVKTLSTVIGCVSSATTLNVYAKTKAECEAKLAELIREMKAEIAAGKEREKQTALAG